MDIRMILSIFRMLPKKSILFIIILGIGGYFLLTKYEDKVIQKVPQAKGVKEKIDSVKKIIS
jgi:hypothetical protein